MEITPITGIYDIYIYIYNIMINPFMAITVGLWLIQSYKSGIVYGG